VPLLELRHGRHGRLRTKIRALVGIYLALGMWGRDPMLKLRA
jgi:hypothetical protein